MRLLDLLDVINLTTRQYRPQIEEAGRLALMKMAFPRPDLLAWFDNLKFASVEARHYFPLLACAFLLRSQPKVAYWRLILCGSPDSLAIRQVNSFSSDMPKHVWTLGTDGAIPAQVEMPPVHEVGVVIGIFERSGEISALFKCLAIDFRHATHLFILSDEAMAALDERSDLERPIGGKNSLFEGPFLRWGAARWHAVYVSNGVAE